MLQILQQTINYVYLDINECAKQDHGCSAHAVCRNTKGSHNCTCKPGYSGDGRTCQGNVMNYCLSNLEPHILLFSILPIQCYKNKCKQPNQRSMYDWHI